jgi:Fe-S-cluster formation regulator IscX/YfhJ
VLKMLKQQKLCFVIMAFGKKTDLSTGKTLDLDKTYKNIIKPAVEKSGLQCVRADEIQDSGLIDRSMYALLMHADLVVADISTYNPNAIYELGIRHAVRPYSTIIIKEQEGVIPFDLNHSRIFHYAHLGDDIGVDEAERCKDALVEMIGSILKNKLIDSPLYDYIQDIEPPKLTSKEYKRIIGDLSDREESIFAISERAKHFMEESNFIDAAKLWDKAESIVPNEVYFTQQHALAKYKSKHPTEISALTDALKIIEKLEPDNETNDPETLGLTGAIYKRMWHTTSDVECLKRAIHFYGKGFQIRRDYYNGENYALCLNFAASIESNADEKTFYVIAAKKARQEMLHILAYLCDKEENLQSINKWPYATLANCYFGLGDNENGVKYEKVFFNLVDLDWEKNTYLENKEMLIKLIEGK